MSQQPDTLDDPSEGVGPSEVDMVRALVDEARDGDSHAFRELVERYQRAVYGLAYRMMGDHEDADDMVQEAFVRVYQALDRYEPQYSFYTWVRNITVRLCINELAKRKRRKTDTLGEAGAFDRFAGGDPGPFEALAAEETARRIDAVVETLPLEQRQVFVMRVREEMSYQEMARLLEIPVGTVMSRLSRARAAVLASLEVDAKEETRES